MILIYLGGIILLVVLSMEVKDLSSKIGKDSGAFSDKKYPYTKRDRLMNSSEQAFYINLREQLGQDFLVFSKVRIEDFVGLPKYFLDKSKVWGLRGRIKSRHIDFLICSNQTTEPLMGIEVDGSSHNNPKRRARDRFVDEVYKDINLLIEHIKVGSDFQQEAIRIREVLNKK